MKGFDIDQLHEKTGLPQALIDAIKDAWNMDHLGGKPDLTFTLEFLKEFHAERVRLCRAGIKNDDDLRLYLAIKEIKRE